MNPGRFDIFQIPICSISSSVISSVVRRTRGDTQGGPPLLRAEPNPPKPPPLLTFSPANLANPRPQPRRLSCESCPAIHYDLVASRFRVCWRWRLVGVLGIAQRFV